jgi:hypothetical protein
VRASARSLLFVCAWLSIQLQGVALIDRLSDRDVSRALAIANGDEPSRARYHQPYFVPVKNPAVEQIEVITEFRRLVLTAESELQAGNWMFARGGYDQKGRTLKDVISSSSGRVAIRTRLRFHPQNVYVKAPLFDILLGEPTLVALETERSSDVLAPKKNDIARPVIIGATVEAAFDAGDVGNRSLLVRVVTEGTEVARGSVDFSRLE